MTESIEASCSGKFELESDEGMNNLDCDEYSVKVKVLMTQVKMHQERETCATCAVLNSQRQLQYLLSGHVHFRVVFPFAASSPTPATAPH